MDVEKSDIKSIIRKIELFKPLAGKSVLVTGATGLIGSMLIKVLCSANYKYSFGIKIIGMIRNIEKAKTVFEELFNKIEFITDEDVSCDYIIHTISPTRSKFFIEYPVETIKISVESTMRILEIAKNNKAKVIYLSSMEQYGVPYKSGQAMTEDMIGVIDHLNVRSSYSESKRLCECLCVSYASEYGIDVKIARLAQTIGVGVPLTDNRMPMQFARAVIENRDIVLHTEGKSVSNFIYLSDAITGILMILLRGEVGEAYNLCNDKETRSVREIAELISTKVAGERISVKVKIPEGNMGYAKDVKMYLDSSKLRNLGWNYEVNMEEAYKRLIEYIKLKEKV